MPSRETLEPPPPSGLVIWVTIAGARALPYFFQHAAGGRAAPRRVLRLARRRQRRVSAARRRPRMHAAAVDHARAGGLPFFRPWPLLGLTLAGILLSSASIYFFSESLHLDELLARRHPQQRRQAQGRARQVRDAHHHRLELLSARADRPDRLRVRRAAGDVKKCLLGVLIGEGAICAIYIFGGDWLLRALHLRS